LELIHFWKKSIKSVSFTRIDERGAFAATKQGKASFSQVSSDIEISRPAAGVGAICINRPQVKNALATGVLRGIADALAGFAADKKNIRCVLLRGAGGNFAAGADLREIAKADAQSVRKTPRPALWRAISEFDKPLIAAVEGVCFGGGCELALCCDIVIAARDARFAQPEVRLGLMPGAGGAQKWLRALGRRRASLHLFSGEAIRGEEAFAAGLISGVCEPGGAQARAMEIAEKIAARPPEAIAAIKRALVFGENAALAQALDFERENYFNLFCGDEWRAGVAAFFERKRDGV
jgi:enoyl-CoA hydratase/carnithine racemase